RKEREIGEDNRRLMLSRILKSTPLPIILKQHINTISSSAFLCNFTLQKCFVIPRIYKPQKQMEKPPRDVPRPHVSYVHISHELPGSISTIK
ncbi:hypothetical protein L9F63_015424, partial [Diploptera punctata]